MNSHFTIWREPGKRTWRFTLWSPNSRPLMESLTSYASKATARKGCKAVAYCFIGDAPLEILDGRSQ